MYYVLTQATFNDDQHTEHGITTKLIHPLITGYITILFTNRKPG